MKNILKVFTLLVVSSAFAQTYEKIGDHVLKRTHSVEQVHHFHYDRLLARKAALEAELAKVNALIAEAENLEIVRSGGP